MSRNSQSLFVLGASHRTASISAREQFSVPEDRIQILYERLKALPGVSETAILNTCNRTELYAVLNGRENTRLIEREFQEFQNIEDPLLSENAFRLHDDLAARHLFEVAAGIDSLVIGETEILGQVKECYLKAERLNSLGPLLNRLFQKSFQAAKWVRTHTGIGRGQVSVGSVAADLATKIFGNLKTCRILVVGAGEISERTISALKSRGAESLTISNRTDQKAMQLAQAFGGSALPYSQLHSSLANFEIAICSTASPNPILTADQVRRSMKDRTYRPLFIIDLALPRDVDPAAGDIESLFLYNIDDLSQIADENLRQREAEIERCREILNERARYFWERQKR